MEDQIWSDDAMVEFMSKEPQMTNDLRTQLKTEQDRVGELEKANSEMFVEATNQASENIALRAKVERYEEALNVIGGMALSTPCFADKILAEVRQALKED